MSNGSRIRYAPNLMEQHFGGLAPEEIVTAARTFPARMRADLQIAVDQVLTNSPSCAELLGLRPEHRHMTLELTELWREGRNAVVIGPLQYTEVDIGDDEPVRCLKDALWLLQQENLPHVVILSEHQNYRGDEGIHVEVGVPTGVEGSKLADRYFRAIEESIAASSSYRGKVLSLEQEFAYSGQSTGVRVHRLPGIKREQVILPQQTLELLERNVFAFYRQRVKLTDLRMSTKKGLLFYGPPGTGKTHSIHYLASELTDHTTLLITADQINLLAEYMALARLLQPSIVVMEDADLIARERGQNPFQETLLNQLLNEMDGLHEDADILFILTTNHPESLETALTSRPGRIDQAIEFPLPNDDGRRKLMHLYAGDLVVPEDVARAIVVKTDGVSPAFIKELMRRAAQYCLDRGDSGSLELADVDDALQEMLILGGRLNASLLGGNLGAEAP